MNIINLVKIIQNKIIVLKFIIKINLLINNKILILVKKNLMIKNIKIYQMKIFFKKMKNNPRQ